MITEQDLQEAIAECQGIRNPNANTAIKLAAFLTIQRELFGEETAQKAQVPPTYSYAPGPSQPEPYFRQSGAEPVTVGDHGSSDFLQAVRGKDPGAMWKAMDELMDTLKMVNERVYNSVMRKIR